MTRMLISGIFIYGDGHISLIYHLKHLSFLCGTCTVLTWGCLNVDCVI